MAITFNSGYDYSPHKKANPVERGTIKSGTAMSFDGTSDYITVTNPTSGLDMGTTQDFSISLWLKASTQGDTYPSVIGSGTSSWSAGATAVRIGPNGNLKFLEFYAYNDSSGGTPLLTSTSEVVDDVWHFGVITRDGSSWTLYLDGESQDTGTSSASINLAHNGTLYIGKNGWDASSELDGQLSKLQIWNTALTLAQVQELYKQPELLLPTGTPNDSANSWSDLVVGQYLLNEGAGYTAFDSHIPLGEKKYGETSIVFDGTGDYLSIPDSNDWELGDTYTLEFWCRCADVGASQIGPCHQDDASSNRGLLTLIDGGKWKAGKSGSLLASTSDVDDDAWHHLVMSVDSGTGHLYVDGTREATGSVNDIPAVSGNFEIGRWRDSSGEYLDGYIDDLRITKGLAIYTGSTFDVPTSALTTTWSASTGIAANTDASKVVLLIHGDNSKNRPAGGIVDSSSGSELKFGGSDYVDLGDDSSLGLGSNAFTVSVWCTITGGGNATSIFELSDNYPSAHYLILSTGYNTTNSLGVSGGGSWAYGGSISGIGDGDWHHLVGIWDGAGTSTSNYSQYVDNVAGTFANTGSMSAKPDNTIGRGNYNNFTGSMSQVAVFAGVLSSSDIETLYNGGRYGNVNTLLSTPASLKGYWILDSDSTVTDLSTNSNNGSVVGAGLNRPHAITVSGDAKLTDYRSHGTVSGATWDTGNNEIYQTGLVKGRGTMNFDGTNDYVNLMAESVITGTGNFTVSCWASWGGSSTRQIWNQRASGDPNPSTGLLVNQATGNIRFETYTSDYQQYINSTSTNLNSNALNHIVCVRDGTTSIKLYVNGVLEGSHSAGSAVTLTAVPFDIGRNTSGSNYFPGFVDEFAMWDEALSQSEITTLYNNAIPYAATNIQSSNLKGYWRNDGISTWTDRSTNSNHGTVSGSPSLLFLPEGSTADMDTLGFPLQDTVSDVLSLNDPAYFEFPPNSDLAFGSKDFTVEFWINIQELATGVLIGNAWGSSITDRAGWSLYWYTGDGKLYLSWSNVVGSSFVGDLSQTWTPDLNTWIHFHLIKSGTTFTFYENNAVIGSSMSETDPMPTELTKPFRLSSDPDDTAANFFNARYDEVRVYHKALSSAERIQNYNHGAVAHGKTVIEE